MAPNLTIRNLTRHPITLVHIERFGPPPQSSNPLNVVSRFAVNATTTVGITSAKNHTVTDTSVSLHSEDVNLRVEPFGILNTDKEVKERDATEVLRLTLDVEGRGRYKQDVPEPKRHSNDLLADGHDHPDKYSTVFVPEASLLAILPKGDLSNWMQRQHDRVPLSTLSIPGTHNSPTHYKALPSVRCQAVSPKDQLYNGVRFFDIRVQPPAPSDDKNTSLTLVHGVFPISLTGSKPLRALLDDVESFLADRPSETVVICLKREGVGEHTDQQLTRLLREHYINNEKWYTEPRIPRLGEVRGKMVLMRRFDLDDAGKGEHGGQGWGINADGWAYNTRCDEKDSVVVQDFCEVLETVNINEKIDSCCSFLHRTGEGNTAIDVGHPDVNACGPVPKLHLNFLSASNFWKVGTWPEAIAKKVNPGVSRHLLEKHVLDKGDADASTGTVVCDWVGEGGDWDLVRTIVVMNEKLKVKCNL